MEHSNHIPFDRLKELYQNLKKEKENEAKKVIKDLRKS